MDITKIKNISALQASEILEADSSAILLDVRTNMEYEYVGHVPNSLHIAWVDAPDWSVDKDFLYKVTQVLSQLSLVQQLESLPILGMCRSGKRSFAALALLRQNGFSQLYNIADGFEGDLDQHRHRNTLNGWRAAGLPWVQS